MVYFKKKLPKIWLNYVGQMLFTHIGGKELHSFPQNYTDRYTLE